MEEAEKRMVFSRDPLCAVPWAQGQDMLSWGVHVLPVGPDAQQRRAAFLWEGTGGKWNFVEAVLSKGSSKVMCDLHMGWMEDGVEEEARALSRAEVMREGVLVVGGSGKRDAHKMHPCGWRRRKMSRMILGLQRWEEICNQDSFSLVPSLCICTCVCIPVHVCVCNGRELWALLTLYRLHGQVPPGIKKQMCFFWEDEFSCRAQMCFIPPWVLPAPLTGWRALPLGVSVLQLSSDSPRGQFPSRKKCSRLCLEAQSCLTRCNSVDCSP